MNAQIVQCSWCCRGVTGFLNVWHSAQTVCQLTYVENDAGDDAAARSPQHSEELRATSEQERADRDTSNTDAIGSSPVPAIIDDSLSSVDVEQYLPTDSLDIDG